LTAQVQASSSGRLLLPLILLLLVLGFAFQGSRAIWEPDEGRYTSIALQMLDSGDWWVPRYSAAETHLAKPPLTYWLIAGSVKLFGRNEWAVRLPYALAFLLTGLLVFDLAGALGIATPRFAAFVWATSLAPFAAANIVTADVFLALFETAAVAAFARSGALRAARADPGWIRVMWLAFGLGFATKGPPALLPVLAMAAAGLMSPRRCTPRSLFDPLGMVIFLVVGLGWHLSLVLEAPALSRYFLGYELVDRLFTSAHDRNATLPGLIRAYLPAIALGTLPWLPILMLSRFRRRRPLARAQARAGAEPDTRRFLWLWLTTSLIVFASARSRLPLYLLPLFVPFALLISEPMAALWHSYRWGLMSFSAIWLAGLLSIKAIAAHAPVHRDARSFSRALIGSARQMSQPMTSVNFIEPARSIRGTRLYTGVPATTSTLRARSALPGETSAPPAACALASQKGHPLWIVPASQVRAFEHTIASCGYSVRLLRAPAAELSAIEIRADHLARAH
jgi:4-amino-4-deoxy-L-arabinose transferase